MSKPDPATGSPEPAIDPAVARTEHSLALLERLAEKGLALAEAVPEDGSAESAQAFAKLSRAVRLTIALKARLEEGPRPRTAGATAQAETPKNDAGAEAADPFAALKTGRKARVRDLVREVIDRETPDAEDNDILVDALEERLLCDEAYDDIEDLPVRDVVERLCADLKLKPNWSRWTGEGWKPNPPFTRPLCSDFRTPSRRPILNDAPGRHPLE
jgi:hypothetical protein